MKGTFTFTDGASNQTNLTIMPKSAAKENRFLFAKDLLKKFKQLFVQREIIEPMVNTIFIEKPINNVQTQTIISQNNAIEATIPVIVINKKSHASQLNYQLNIQQMNLFTYLRDRKSVV